MAAVIDMTAQTDPRVYNERPNGAASITGILLHHTGDPNAAAEAGTIRWLSTYHAGPVSINKLIKRDGTIVKIVPDDKRAWHAGASRWAGVDDCNDFMIGYEICNNGVGEAYTDAQYASIAESIAYDTALYHIRDADVTSHRMVRMLWNIKYPGRADSPKTDPLGLDITRVFEEAWDIRLNWPWGSAPPMWHWWLQAFGRLP